jgi:hypothetical protein
LTSASRRSELGHNSAARRDGVGDLGIGDSDESAGCEAARVRCGMWRQDHSRDPSTRCVGS